MYPNIHLARFASRRYHNPDKITAMKPSFDLIPAVSVHPDRINIYSQVHWQPYKPKGQTKEYLRTLDKSNKGKISPQARRKINKAVDYLVYLSNDKALPAKQSGRYYKFKISFLTLTLSSKQIHTDHEIKQMFLNQFLVEARKRWQMLNYVWRAEKQSNGNIHFHILCDKFIPWSELRDTWNRIQNKLGYVDRYRDEMRSYHEGGFKVRQSLLDTWDYKKQIKAYKVGVANDWSSPNSTDVHSIRFIKDVKAYIAQYMAKNESDKDILGRLWGCSTPLSSLKGGQGVRDSLITDELNRVVTSVNPRTYGGDYFTVLYISIKQLKENNCTSLLSLFEEFLSEKFNI